MSVETRRTPEGGVEQVDRPHRLPLPRARHQTGAGADRIADAVPREPLPAAGAWVVENLTPRPIWVENDGRVFTLGPLEERTWPPAGPPVPGTAGSAGAADAAGARQAAADPPWVAFPDLVTLVDRHQLDIRRPPATLRPDRAQRLAVRAALIAAFLWLAAFWVLPTWWWARTGGALAVVAGVWSLWLATRAPDERRYQVRRWTAYNAVMVLVVAVGVLGPAGALYLATDLHDVVSVWPGGFRIDTSEPLVLVGRLMQLTFIAIATLLPALMYFQFDAERLGTLRDRWIQNVFRLDPTVSTACDVTAKYGKQLEEAYGSPADGRGRLTRGRRSPIICTTMILAFGWLLILLKAGDRIEDGAAEGSISFIALLDPSPSLVTYAFLGAYFFGIQLVWQGYLRADLRPKTYTTITVRVLIVVVLAWLMDATLGLGETPQYAYLLAFAAGFVPDSVLHLMWERVLSPGVTRKLGLGSDRRQPLTELEGIDLYERTRLSEEGITSVEALAHHDLLDLFFKTRIPAARLVDWMDQAVLVMYLSEDQPLREALRAVGVRTASDLVDRTRRPRERAPVEHQDTFETLLETVRHRLPESDQSDVRLRLLLIADALDHSEWIGRIENWRRSDLIEADPAKRCYIGAGGELHRGDPRVRRAPPPRTTISV
jgi:hypothetical protein